MNASTLGAALVAVSALASPPMVLAAAEQDRAEIAAIDTKYQDAVKRNDAETMAQILHEDFVLVLGTGKTYTRADLLESARTRHITYERQDEDAGTQTVRHSVWRKNPSPRTSGACTVASWPRRQSASPSSNEWTTPPRGLVECARIAMRSGRLM